MKQTQGNTGTVEISLPKEMAIFQAPIRVVPDQASVFDDTLVDAQAMADLHSKSAACIVFTNAEKNLRRCVPFAIVRLPSRTM